MANKEPTKKEMLQEIALLDKVTNALNTAVVALMYITKVKGNELDKVSAKEYVEYVEKHVHPLMRQADRIVREAADNAKKDIDKATKEVEKEHK